MRDLLNRHPQIPRFLTEKAIKVGIVISYLDVEDIGLGAIRAQGEKGCPAGLFSEYEYPVGRWNLDIRDIGVGNEHFGGGRSQLNQLAIGDVKLHFPLGLSLAYLFLRGFYRENLLCALVKREENCDTADKGTPERHADTASIA